MQVPIFGQEEDAADDLSILLINDIFEESSAQSTAYDAAFGFVAESASLEETYYWDVHGPDERRYYDLVCIFMGQCN